LRSKVARSGMALRVSSGSKDYYDVF
jgi:hypothetical protein